MNKIQITGNDKNKENAMGSLMDQKTVVHCLPDEMYVVSDEVIGNLEKDKIEFIRLDYRKSIVHDVKNTIPASEVCQMSQCKNIKEKEDTLSDRRIQKYGNAGYFYREEPIKECIQRIIEDLTLIKPDTETSTIELEDAIKVIKLRVGSRLI